MKAKARYILSAASALLLAVLLGVLLSCSHSERKLLTCNSIEISMVDSLKFVTAKEVRSYLDEKYPGIIGERLDSIRLADIESLLSARSSISGCQAWTDGKGVLHVSVSQRLPAMRFGDAESGFYIDDSGFIFPLHRSYTAPVPYVSGNIPVRVSKGFKGEAPREEDRKWLRNMLEYNSFVSKSKEWRNRISSTRIDANGDLVILTSMGPEQIILGKPDNFEEKFGKIGKYYGRIKPQAEKDYKSISVKYNNQIVCRKDM